MVENFKVVMETPRILKNIFGSVNSIVDEVRIKADEKGLHMVALDRSHITFVEMNIFPDAFADYECLEPISLDVDTGEFNKVLGRGRMKDVTTITADENMLTIMYEDAMRKTFGIRLIDIDDKAPEPPNLNYENEFEIPVSFLNDCMGDIGVVSDKFVILYDGDRVKISADGEFGSGEFEYIVGDGTKKPVKSIFSLEKVKEIMKASKLTETVRIGLGDDMPLHIKFVEDGVVELAYLLAPRIEVD